MADRNKRRLASLAPPEVFARRAAKSLAIGFGMIIVSLAIGMIGYVVLEGLDWIDAFLDSAMLLAGMGPIHTPATTAGKAFAGLYALYCGFAVLGIAAVIFAPLLHRLMHRFHLADEESTKD
jgi:NhaP-type Na+/H+ or K+/H+ antiporter